MNEHSTDGAGHALRPEPVDGAPDPARGADHVGARPTTALAKRSTTPPSAPQPAQAPAWRIAAAGGKGVALARPDRGPLAERSRLTRLVQAEVRRRRLLRGGALGALCGAVVLGGGSFLNFVNPRHTGGFGGTVRIPASQILKPGDDPVKFFAMKGFLVNLQPGEGGFGGVAPSERGGLVALYQKCPHLGCAVPWRPEFEFGGTNGWFRCPCHGSTYTKGGLRVFGPAPRSLDTFAITRNGDGSVTVNTGTITLGGLDDPQRGVLPPG